MAHLYMIFDDVPIKHGDFPVRVNVELRGNLEKPSPSSDWNDVYFSPPVMVGEWDALLLDLYIVFFRGKSCY